MTKREVIMPCECANDTGALQYDIDARAPEFEEDTSSARAPQTEGGMSKAQRVEQTCCLLIVQSLRHILGHLAHCWFRGVQRGQTTSNLGAAKKQDHVGECVLHCHPT